MAGLALNSSLYLITLICSILSFSVNASPLQSTEHLARGVHQLVARDLVVPNPPAAGWKSLGCYTWVFMRCYLKYVC
jgi:hypothetical protein